jgi:hypothetical protein
VAGGAEAGLEQRALGRLVVQIGRLPRPGQRRHFHHAIWDTYAVGVPSRRARILGWFLAEAEQAEAAAWRWSAQAELASLTPVAKVP